MAFIEYKKVEFLDRLKRPHCSTYVVAQCEQCSVIFEKKIKTKYNSEEKCRKRLFFCNPGCASSAKKVGGILYKKYQKSVFEKYGVKNVFQLEKIKQKIKENNIKLIRVTDIQFSQCTKSEIAALIGGIDG